MLCCVTLFCVMGNYGTETVTSAQRAWDGIKKKGGELRERITFPFSFPVSVSVSFCSLVCRQGFKM